MALNLKRHIGERIIISHVDHPEEKVAIYISDITLTEHGPVTTISFLGSGYNIYREEADRDNKR